MNSMQRIARKSIPVVALVVLAAIALSGCFGGDDSKGKEAYTGTPGAAGKVIFDDTGSATPLTTKKSKLGEIVAGQADRTLYSFKTDDGKPPDCRGECAWQWLPVVMGKGVRVEGDIDRSKVGVVHFSDRADQLTYGGHPLYFFSEDDGAKSVAGQGKSAFGADWFVVGADGQLITTK